MINIELFKKALEAEIKSGTWASETNEIFKLGIELLSTDMLSDEQDQRMAEIAIGTIITGIAYHNYKYNQETIQGEFYAWPELYNACEMNAFYESQENTLEHSEKMQRVYPQMIRESGARIFTLDLPFDKLSLTTRFPQLENSFHIIDIMRNGQYKIVEDAFNNAFCYEESVERGTNPDKYMKTVSQLKKHVLEQFKAGTEEFSYEKCLGLAERTEELTRDLINNKLTEERLKEYQRCNKIFFKENSTATKVLHVILSTLLVAAATIIGATIGFFVAGPMGMVSGAAAGLAVGAIALASLGIYGTYARKNNPFVQVENAAAEVVSNTPTGL